VLPHWSTGASYHKLGMIGGFQVFAERMAPDGNAFFNDDQGFLMVVPLPIPLPFLLHCIQRQRWSGWPSRGQGGDG